MVATKAFWTNTDQWAIDQIQLSGYQGITLLQDNFEVCIFV